MKYLQKLISWVLLKIMQVLLSDKSPEVIKKKAIQVVSSWDDPFSGSEVTYDVAFRLQPRIAQVTKQDLCKYCDWVIEEGKEHDYCNLELNFSENPDAEYCSICTYEIIEGEDHDYCNSQIEYMALNL